MNNASRGVYPRDSLLSWFGIVALIGFGALLMK